MIYFVSITDYRKIDMVTHAVDKTFAVKALSSKHAIKKARNHLWRAYHIQDVDVISATSVLPANSNTERAFPIVTINSNGWMTGNMHTVHYTV